MKKNDGFSNYDGPPVCRFGPGGDFVTDWPVGTTGKVSNTSRRPIGSVLKAIAKMLDVVITEELLNSSTIEKINLAINGKSEISNMENELDLDKSDESNASPVSGPKAHRQLQEEPMLFDNASGVSEPFGHKPNHGVRTHRRAKRKKTSFGQPWQGSLFEPYSQSSKVA